ncbi:MAG: GNAT family N-acetyltransferase [Oscillospiraceae bacterium]
MIRLMQTIYEAEKAYEFDPILGCRIYTLYNCYDNDYPFLRIWVASEDNNITACISIMCGIATITANDKCNFEELSYFFGHDSTIDIIETNEETGKKINEYLKNDYKTRPIMKFDGEIPQFPIDMKIFTSASKYIFPILQESDPEFDSSDFMAWFYDVHRRMTNGFCEMFTIKDDDDNFVSTAGYYVSSPISAVVGSVATMPNYRGKGYGSALVKFVTGTIKNLCKDSYLIAANDDLIKFYGNLGYSVIGKEWLITMSE